VKLTVQIPYRERRYSYSCTCAGWVGLGLSFSRPGRFTPGKRRPV